VHGTVTLIRRAADSKYSEGVRHVHRTSGTRRNNAAQVASRTLRNAASAALMALLSFCMTPALALDGCKVLLCLAAPSWRAIPECVQTITQMYRDLARRKPFPTCAMTGAGNSARHAWASAPDYCPPQYTRVWSGEYGPEYSCDYAGAVTVEIDGVAFTRTWWGLDGDTSTEFTPTAKARLGTWDGRFDDDYAAWLAAQIHSSAPADPAP
jgi:hypothetical protein